MTLSRESIFATLAVVTATAAFAWPYVIVAIFLIL